MTERNKLSSKLDTQIDDPIVSLDHLRVEFETDGGTVVAVNDISFKVFPGETVCLVGESGSGKSVTSLSLMRLVEFGGGQITGGKMLLSRDGKKTANLSEVDVDAVHINIFMSVYSL